MYKKIDNIMTVKDEEWVGLSQRIKSGELIIYPTDTVYGLGAIISNEESINNIYFAKSRSFNSPLLHF